MKRLLMIRMIWLLLFASFAEASDSDKTLIGLGLHAGKTAHGVSGRLWLPQRLGFQVTYHWKNSQGVSEPRLGLRILYGLGKNGRNRFFIGLGIERERAYLYRGYYDDYGNWYYESVLRTLTQTAAFLGGEIDLQVFENPFVLNADVGVYRISGNEGFRSYSDNGPALIGLGLHYYFSPYLSQ